MKRHILIAFVTAMLLILAIYAGCSALSDATDLPTWTEPVTGMEFVLIPGGRDLLGRTEAETRTLANRFAPKHLKRLFGLDLPQREVHVESFWLARHEVTQKAWATIMGGAPKGCAKGEDLPVSFVTWKEAKDFILTLNTLLPDMKFRLPTEEEWEYACRAGSDSPFNTGESIDGDQANFKAFYVYGEKEKNPDGRYQGKATSGGLVPTQRLRSVRHARKRHGVDLEHRL